MPTASPICLTTMRLLITGALLFHAQPYRIATARHHQDTATFIPMAINPSVAQIKNLGFSHGRTGGDFLHGELVNLSNYPIEHAMITATLIVISGSWPSTTTLIITGPTRFLTTLPGNVNPFVFGISVDIGNVVAEPVASATVQFGNSANVQRIDVVQLDIPPNDTRYASALLKNNNSYPIYDVTLSIWSLPLCNAIFEFPIRDVLQAGESITTTVPFCPYGGLIRGAIGALAQGNSVP